MKNVDLAELQKRWHGTFIAYIAGLLASIVLTLAAYFVVVGRYFSAELLTYTIITLGMVQALAQVLFFLHLGKEKRPHWNLMVFLLMILIVLIVVLGSLWIMYNLDERVMSDMSSSHVKHN